MTKQTIEGMEPGVALSNAQYVLTDVLGERNHSHHPGEDDILERLDRVLAGLDTARDLTEEAVHAITDKGLANPDQRSSREETEMNEEHQQARVLFQQIDQAIDEEMDEG